MAKGPMPAIMSHTTSPALNVSTSLCGMLITRASAQTPPRRTACARAPAASSSTLGHSRGGRCCHAAAPPSAPRIASVLHQAARAGWRASKHVSPARTSNSGTRNSLSMVPTCRDQVRRGATGPAIRRNTLLSTVFMRPAFFSSSTRPTSSLYGNCSSRRFRCAMWPTVSNEVGTSMPGGSNVCARAEQSVSQRRQGAAAACGALATRAPPSSTRRINAARGAVVPVPARAAEFLPPP